jgi:hypothetical protein
MKHDFSTKFTLGGNVILCKFMQEEKADLPIISISTGKIISVIFVQWQKEKSSIFLTDSGIKKEETLEQPKNASVPIVSRLGGRMNDGINLQLKKTESANTLTF